MEPKPKGLGSGYASQFKDRSVVEAYRYRPPYPAQTFELLTELIAQSPARVLDIGCGTGFITRPLARHVDWIDAVDFSSNMIEMARKEGGGDRANIRWIEGAVETVALDPPYALVTAGASLHWMDWAVVLPRLQAMLAPGAFLCLVHVGGAMAPAWRQELIDIIQRYSTNRDFKPYDTVAELEKRGLFRKVGVASTPSVPRKMSVAEYVESIHARNGFSRDRMSTAAAAAFDAEASALLACHCPDGIVTLETSGNLVWGYPLAP